MKCEKVKKKLNDYIAGSLKGRESKIIEKHLSDCSICTEELAFIKEIESLFTEIDCVEPPQELWDSIKRRIETDRKSGV